MFINENGYALASASQTATVPQGVYELAANALSHMVSALRVHQRHFCSKQTKTMLKLRRTQPKWALIGTPSVAAARTESTQ
jgi:hypothetical protein